MSAQIEAQQLAAIANKPALARLPTYLKLSGPGWLQGAMTLGGGSAITSLTLGAVYGYDLLWVQPLAMIIGYIMLFALSHQTLSTGEKPYRAMKKHISPTLAFLWAFAAIASSIIWGFSHYPLSAGMIEEVVSVASGADLASQEGAARETWLFLFAVLTWCVCAYTAWNYGRGGKPVQVFETAIKWLSTGIILAFLWVVVYASIQGKVDWSAVFAGFIPGRLPTDLAGVTTVMAALGTAVGINMTFIYGYTLLERGWGREHRELARYDIVMGLVVPYILVTTLIAIAAAGALHGSGMDIQGKLSPAKAALMFTDAGIDPITGRLIFAIGILGMAVGSLVMHMLCCGAVAAELFKLEPHSKAYRLCLLLPTPAVLGVFLWSTMGAYVILPTSAISGFLLPIAYLGWLLLNNRKDFMGDDRPQGGRAWLFNTAMAVCILTVLSSVVFSTSVAMGVDVSAMTNIKDGASYAPTSDAKKVVNAGEFCIAAAFLDHGHIYGQVNGLRDAGATLKYVYDPDSDRLKAFCEKYPEVQPVSDFETILNAPDVHMVCSAAVPSERAGIGLRVLQADKHYFTDKAPFTTLEQLEEVKQVVEQTGRRYFVYYAERIHNDAAWRAGELIAQGAVGRVLQVINIAPHRLNKGNRPDWFFQKARYGGILTDIGSHQVEQFLTYASAQDAAINFARVENFSHSDYPELEDFGEFSMTADNGASFYSRVDWYTPDGLRTWGDGRTFILGTTGSIELRKYIDITRNAPSSTLLLVDQHGEQREECLGQTGFPFFGQMILDCLEHTEQAMSQKHIFMAAELSLRAQLLAEQSQ